MHITKKKENDQKAQPYPALLAQKAQAPHNPPLRIINTKGTNEIFVRKGSVHTRENEISRFEDRPGNKD